MEIEFTTDQKKQIDKYMRLSRDELIKKVLATGEEDIKVSETVTKKELAQALVLSESEIGSEDSTQLPEQESPLPDSTPEKNEFPTSVKEETIFQPPVSLASENLKESGIAQNTSLGSEELRVREEIWSQPLVTVMIPLEEGEKMGASHPVTINGYRLVVPKNTMVKVPKPIAEMLAERFKMQLGTGAIELEKQFDLNRSSQMSDALN